MSNGAPKNPETIEGFITGAGREIQTGPTKGKATKILAVTEHIDQELRIAEEFLRDTNAAETGILALLREEFDLNEGNLETRRREKNKNLHQELVDHTYRAYHEFLSGLASLIGQLDGNIDKKKILATVLEYCKKQKEDSVYRWLEKNDDAKGAIKDMVENGVSRTNREQLIGAIQRARTGGVQELRTFTEDKITPLLRTVDLLRETKNGTPQEVKERLEREIKDVPSHQSVLEIFNDYRRLIELEGKDRGLEVRIAGQRIELQPNDLENTDATKMQEIAALYASGAHIVFIAYLTKAPAK